MIVSCSKCGEVFKSLIIDKDIAFQAISKQTTEHVRKVHKNMFEEMHKMVMVCSMAMTTVMHFNEFVSVPEAESYINGVISKGLDTVMAGIGFDAEEDDEDIEDEDTEEETLKDTGEESVESTELTSLFTKEPLNSFGDISHDKLDQEV